ncbi:MAG: transketolase [Planctomycetota bacterium]
MAAISPELEKRCIDTIRILSADIVEKAKSGHPGMPMAMAPAAHLLWSKVMRYNPADPAWPNRDRFILSAGHGSPLLYTMLHLAGYDLTMDDLKGFRQWETRTPGHPEYGHTAGVEATTGPLGQGFSMGVGMALAQRMMAATFNRENMPVVDHFIYAICSDGDLMEGVAAEAASLAGHQRLGRLIYVYDDNHITIEGDTAHAFSEDVVKRFKAYGWHVQELPDVNDTATLTRAIRKAQAETEKPSLIKVRSHIGFGSPKQDDESCHGAALGADALAATKKNFGFDPAASFVVAPEVAEVYRKAAKRAARAQAAWKKMFAAYRQAHPELAAEFERRMSGKLPAGWDSAIPAFKATDKPIATRSASGKIMNSFAKALPELVGGSADLAPSTRTWLDGIDAQSPATPAGRNFHFGVREHAMGAAVNGMALYGGFIPFGATFFVFADFCRPALRLAAIMNTHTVWVFTHDSVGVGEDGPTHQPVEQLASIRAIPNFIVLRPADANETAEAWRIAVTRRGPVMLALTRQDLPNIEHPALKAGVAKGAYILKDAAGTPDIILIATGSEVTPTLAAADILAKDGVKARVVSMPSWELFAGQTQAYRDNVLPPAVTRRMAVEAGSSFGWDRWVGSKGKMLCIDGFGKCGPVSAVMAKYGYTPENIAKEAKTLL